MNNNEVTRLPFPSFQDFRYDASIIIIRLEHA